MKMGKSSSALLFCGDCQEIVSSLHGFNKAMVESKQGISVMWCLQRPNMEISITVALMRVIGDIWKVGPLRLPSPLINPFCAGPHHHGNECNYSTFKFLMKRLFVHVPPCLGCKEELPIARSTAFPGWA